VIAALLAVALSVEPAQVRLGGKARALLRVQAALEPTLSASVGRVEGLRLSEGGAYYEADYIPPEEQLPQVAIVTAVAGTDVAWVSIPLWAEGDAVVKTRPRGKISVRIGSEEFGPVIADARGEAVVPVVVPPGVHEAHHGKRAIPLHVPPARTVHLTFGEAARVADRAQTVAVYVVAVTADGTPRSGAAIRLWTSRGDLSALRQRAPGLYEARLSLAPGRPGPVRVTATLDDARQFVAEATIALTGGASERIAISADRAGIHAEDPQARLHVVARDSLGNVPSEELEFVSTAGLLRAVHSAPGEWDLTLSVPSSFGGRAAVEVRARGSKSSASHALPLLAGPLETAAFEHPEATLIADGASALRLRIELRDRYGNTVSGAQPEVSAELGSARLEESDGALYARYLPPLLHERGASTLALQAGPAAARARLTLLPDLQSTALSAKVGALSNFSGFSAPLLGLEAALRTDRFGPELAVSLETDYAHRGYSKMQRVGTSTVLAESRVELLLVHLSAAWRRRFGDLNTVWISGGPSTAAIWTRVKLADSPMQRGFAIAPGLQGSLGAERRFRSVVPFVELRAGWITSSGLPILQGPLRTVSVFGGVRLETL
jgi:hypothetical protein